MSQIVPKNKAQQIPQNANRYMPAKIEKLEKIQRALVRWLDCSINKYSIGLSKEDQRVQDEWQEIMSYVLKCENRPLNAKDIKKLNFLYKFYNGEVKKMSMDYLASVKA